MHPCGHVNNYQSQVETTLCLFEFINELVAQKEDSLWSDLSVNEDVQTKFLSHRKNDHRKDVLSEPNNLSAH